MAKWVMPIAIGSALAGCGVADDAGLQPCDPFDAHAQPISLRTILGIGRDTNETIYLADEADGEEDHVFVSADGELVRRRITGSGGGGGTYSFSLEDPLLTLQIFTPPAGPVRMGVVAGETDSFVIGEEGEELEVLDPDAIADMPLRNLSGEIELEYAAETDDGRLMVVTRPRDDWAYEDFRVFFGSVDALDERIVHSVARQEDGGTTLIELELDGAAATAYFPVELDGPPEPWTLTVADETIPLERRDAVPEDVSYRCLVE